MGRNYKRSGYICASSATREGSTEICFPHGWLKHIPSSCIYTGNAVDKKQGQRPKEAVAARGNT